MVSSASSKGTSNSGASRDSLPDADTAHEFYSKYDLKNILGKGVSSVVRRCVEKSTNREYAVKIIDLAQEDETNEDNIARMRLATLKEIRLLQMCANHSYIIQLHETFVNSSCMFLVLELTYMKETCSNLIRSPLCLHERHLSFQYGIRVFQRTCHVSLSTTAHSSKPHAAQHIYSDSDCPGEIIQGDRASVESRHKTIIIIIRVLRTLLIYK